jgi:hypothetical protein
VSAPDRKGLDANYIVYINTYCRLEIQKKEILSNIKKGWQICAE